MKIIKNVITRLIALLICLGIIAYCANQCVRLVFKYENLGEASYSQTNMAYSDEVNRAFSNAWIYAATLMDDEISSKPVLRQSVIDTLCARGVVDAYGYPEYTTQNFEVYIEKDGVSHLIIVDDSDDLDSRFTKNPDHTVTFSDGEIYNWPKYLDWFYGNSNYGYKTSDGFYYFYLGYLDQGFAFYDYDVTGLEGYEDDLGAIIYINSDGSDPTDNQNHIPLDVRTNEITIKIAPTAATLDAMNYDSVIRESFEKECMDMVMSFIPLAAIVLLLSVFIIVTGGYSTKQGKYRMCGADRIYLEIVAILAAGAAVGMAWLLCLDPFEVLKVSMLEREGYYQKLVYNIYTIATPLLYALILWAIVTVVVRIRCRSFFKTSVIVRAICWVFSKLKALYQKLRLSFITRENLRENAFLRRFLIKLAVAVLAEAVILIIAFAAESMGLFIILSLILFVLFMLWILRDFNSLTKLYSHISEISKGKYDKVEVDESAVTSRAHTNLNDISDGISLAVERQLRSERMKLDLVTNVSHDLKTPLTSIISYIDLLSKEELSPEATDYVKILEEKSQRLKDMVSDVFDLAKATSKTDVDIQKIDLAILTEQVLGDMADKIEISKMDVRKAINLSSAPVMADGKRLYRVLQNCMDNALKYAMPATRIYISLDRVDNRAVLSFKNISSYEMTFTAEEITERFVRGDESRTGDGNGLGLSIAKSFTEACGGGFEIIIEGDMFTSKVSFEICE